MSHCKRVEDIQKRKTLASLSLTCCAAQHDIHLRRLSLNVESSCGDSWSVGLPALSVLILCEGSPFLHVQYTKTSLHREGSSVQIASF